MSKTTPETQMMDDIAHSMLSAGINYAIEKGLPDQRGIDGVKAALEAINKINPTKTQGFIALSVSISPGEDGSNGYEITGGIAGGVDMLTGLVTLISKQIMELSMELAENAPTAPSPNAPSSTTVQ